MDLVAAKNINLLCRLCLSTDNLISIFDDTSTFLHQKISACVNVEIFRNDKMPTSICKLCLTKVDEWVNFKKCCDDSQAKLQQWDSINNIILNKILNMSVDVKDHESDSEDIQIIDNEVTSIKEEPEEEIHLQFSDTEETETEQEVGPFLPQCDLQESTTLEVSDSLLVPTSECSVEDHGTNASNFVKLTPNSRDIHPKVPATKHRTRKRRSARLACPKCKRICKSGGGFARHKIKCFSIEENNVVKERVKRECKKYKPIKQEVGEYSGENANDDFSCQVCAKSFLTEKGLILHSKTHTDRESVDNSLNPCCEICDKVFTSNIGLSNHMRIHKCAEQKKKM